MCLYVLFHSNKHSWWEGTVVHTPLQTRGVTIQADIVKEPQIHETLMNFLYIYSIMTHQKPMSSLVCFLLYPPCLHSLNRCLHLLSGICFVCVAERCSCDFRHDVRCFVVEKRSFVFTLQRVKSQWKLPLMEISSLTSVNCVSSHCAYSFCNTGLKTAQLWQEEVFLVSAGRDRTNTSVVLCV